MPASRPLQVHRESHRLAARHGLLFPMDVLYKHAGMVAPVAKPTTAERIPSPCRELLIQQSGMTSALERHFGGAVAVRVLTSFSRGRWYFRRVLLALQDSGRPVAMGAARLNLDFFSTRVRARILSEQVPLGRILVEADVQYHSRPTGYVQVTPTADMLGFFWMRDVQTLFGRRTQVSVHGKRVGDIV